MIMHMVMSICIRNLDLHSTVLTVKMTSIRIYTSVNANWNINDRKITTKNFRVSIWLLAIDHELEIAVQMSGTIIKTGYWSAVDPPLLSIRFDSSY